MCRHLAYLGPPIALADLLFDAPHSLARQAECPRHQTSGDDQPRRLGRRLVRRRRRPRPTGTAPSPRSGTTARSPTAPATLRSGAFARRGPSRVARRHAGRRPATRRSSPAAGCSRSTASCTASATASATQLRAQRRAPTRLARLVGDADTEVLFALGARPPRRRGRRPPTRWRAVVARRRSTSPTGELNLLLTDGAAVSRHTRRATRCSPPSTSVPIVSEPLDDDAGLGRGARRLARSSPMTAPRHRARLRCEGPRMTDATSAVDVHLRPDDLAARAASRRARRASARRRRRCRRSGSTTTAAASCSTRSPASPSTTRPAPSAAILVAPRARHRRARPGPTRSSSSARARRRRPGSCSTRSRDAGTLAALRAVRRQRGRPCATRPPRSSREYAGVDGPRGRRRLRAPPRRPAHAAARRLVAFLGSTIGNLAPRPRATFLADLGRDARARRRPPARHRPGEGRRPPRRRLRRRRRRDRRVQPQRPARAQPRARRRLRPRRVRSTWPAGTPTHEWIEMRLRVHDRPAVAIRALDLDRRLRRRRGACAPRSAPSSGAEASSASSRPPGSSRRHGGPIPRPTSPSRSRSPASGAGRPYPRPVAYRRMTATRCARSSRPIRPGPASWRPRVATGARTRRRSGTSSTTTGRSCSPPAPTR